MDMRRDMVMRKGGRMILLIDGEMILMENDVMAIDGMRVKRDGTIYMPDGTIYILREDEALPLDRAWTKQEEK